MMVDFVTRKVDIKKFKTFSAQQKRKKRARHFYANRFNEDEKGLE